MFQTTNQLEMLDYRTVKKMKILGLTPLRGDIFKVPLPVLAGAVRPSKDLCFKYAFKHQQQCGVYHFFLDMYIHTYRNQTYMWYGHPFHNGNPCNGCNNPHSSQKMS